MKHEQAESIHAKNHALVDLVEMRCKHCSRLIDYYIHDSCPQCGRITISCPECHYEFEFGE